MTNHTTPAHAVDNARQVLLALGSHLAAARREHHVTVRALAELTGLRPDVINRIEKGTWCPSPADHATLHQWLLQHPLADEGQIDG